MASLLWLAHFLCFFLFHLHFQASLSFSFNSSSAAMLCQHDQSLALLQFKKTFSITSDASSWDFPYPKPYPKTESWKEGTDCCWWDGVTCDIETGNVIGLNLSSSLLYGTIHSNNALFFLPHLQKLDLSNNDFNRSQIVPQFGQFLNLSYLNLNYSVFEGRIPLEISYLSGLVSLDVSRNNYLILEATTFNELVHNLSQLRELDLSEVNMSLVAPSSLMNLSFSLTSLNLHSCSLEGKFPDISHLSVLVSLDLSDNYDLIQESTYFKKLVQNLTQLQELDLSGVNMSLVALSSLMNLSSSLTSLKLSRSQLHGKFPDISHLSVLVSLDLSDNYDLIQESTYFKKLVQNLTQLQELDLSGVNMSLVALSSLMNLSSSLTSLKLRRSQLHGKFPDISHLSVLVSLDLSDNYDLIQESTYFKKLVQNLTQLQELDLSGVNMSLVALSSLINLSSSLTSLKLRRSQLHGKFPDISHLSKLVSLVLSHNNFNGEIPSSFGNLKQLRTLSLRNSSLGGQIPSSLGSLKELFILDLSYNNFNDEIPSSFENLKQLEEMYLSNNNLSGQIPSSLGSLKELFLLGLSYNNFNGEIPSSFENLKHLLILDLSNNNLSGQISSLLTGLKDIFLLDLSDNNFKGRITIQGSRLSSLAYLDLSNNLLHGPIPSSIFKLVRLSVVILSSNKLIGEVSSAVCELNSLQILDLSNNSLNGFMPQCLGNFSNNLSVLHLGMNKFHGTILESFSIGNNLRYLNFNGNQLQGKIPPSICNCTNLEILDIGNNNIDDTFPHFLATLSKLQILILKSNKFHGLVKGTSTNYSFSKLRIFDLSNNMFNGPLPAEYFNNFKAMMIFDLNMKYMGAPNYSSYDYSVSLTLKGLEIELVKIQTLLTSIDLSGNKFTGEIPQSIGKLKSLKLLNLSHNQLTGNIQPSLGNLSNLESLDLSSNLLVGRIPMQLTYLTFLEVFRVSNNQLEGPVPEGKQFNTFDSISYEGNLGLCGFPLEKCDNGERQQPAASKEIDSKSKIGFGWKVVSAGYGCGVIFGIAMGYVVFKTRKPTWVVRMVEGEGHRKLKRFSN
ncbi:receptor-like protein 9DC3 [Hevea brasiliensis]|uniref:receptor-like protein 9DC3 n=1 Tax=Hevea brasiliensis TaxID=3981 RepID=UPI0025EDDD80|nr:receptor-like protein 9DC3 [Hevea brasiliensis]